MPSPSYEQMQEMFRAHTQAALKVIVEIMNGSGGKGDAVRLSAAKEILSRAWGKPVGREKKKEKQPLAEMPGTAMAADAEDAEEAALAKAASSPSATPKPPAARAPAPWFRSNSTAAAPDARPATAGG